MAVEERSAPTVIIQPSRGVGARQLPRAAGVPCFAATWVTQLKS